MYRSRQDGEPSTSDAPDFLIGISGDQLNSSLTSED